MADLAVSLLSADFSCLEKQLQELKEADVKWLHIDVMDGNFVPSISFGFPIVKTLRKAFSGVFDVHLMIQEPIRYIKEFAESGSDMITIHLEACEDVEATIQKIRDCNMKVGLSICPETPAEAIEHLLPKVDMLLVMSVHPGFGGQKFIPESLDKIRKIRAMINEQGLQVDIQVDGGIYLTNVREVLDAGANIIVAGSAVFGGDPGENTKKFMEILKDYE